MDWNFTHLREHPERLCCKVWLLKVIAKVDVWFWPDLHNPRRI